MKVYDAYRQAWQRRALVVPVILGVKLLSLALIAPVSGVLIRLGVSLSGQSAVTDQDIAYFIASPLGFPVFLLVVGISMIGSVFGIAALTMDLHSSPGSGLAAIHMTLRRLATRFPALLRYGAGLTLRVLVIVLPFTVLAMSTAGWLISDHDINYYLSARPPEFLSALAIAIVLLTAMTALLLYRLLGWAVSLHYVLFAGVGSGAAFAASRAALTGHRFALLKALTVWGAIRVGITTGIGAIFVVLIKQVPSAFDGALVTWMAVVAVLAGLWSLSGLLVSALSLGALARILDTFYNQGPRAAPAPVAPRLSPAVSPASVVVGILACLGVGLYSASGLLSQVQTDPAVLVIAHRGAATTRPENTLAAIREAVEQGADWVEIDVQETADGHVVVIHDSDLMKLAGNPLKIWDATLDDLAGIDIGTSFDPAYGAERVPTLAEVLEITRDRATLLIELKYYGHDVDLEQRVAAIVEAAGMQDQVAVMSLKYTGVQKMRALRPDWPAGVLASTSLGDLTALNADFIAINAARVGPRLLRSAHDKGKQVFVWTINDPLEMSAMISLGVDGLITDDPALARDMLAWRADMSASERLLVMLFDRLGLTDQLGSPMMRARSVPVLAMMVVSGIAAADPATTPDDGFSIDLELAAHRALARVRATADLAAFTTDGCSGGMSATWRAVASLVPGFDAVHGDVPPWETCCVNHDRTYHHAGPDRAADASFAARLAADERLRACVQNSALDQLDDLSAAYDLSESFILEGFATIADSMFAAVRAGGGPCSGLPWRWGYGYPHCLVAPQDFSNTP